MNAEHIKAEWTKALATVSRERMLTLIGEQSANRDAAERRAREARAEGFKSRAERADAFALLHADLREMAVRAYYG